MEFYPAIESALQLEASRLEIRLKLHSPNKNAFKESMVFRPLQNILKHSSKFSPTQPLEKSTIQRSIHSTSAPPPLSAHFSRHD
jgi:hypothetical protein